MRVGVPRERREGERRVALVPESAKKLIATGVEVAIETGAGLAAGIDDEEYREAGASVVDAAQAWAADVVAKVERPLPDELDRLREGGVLVAALQHVGRPEVAPELAARGVTAIAIDWMPRTTRAQAMDVRSSMSTVQGYEAVLLAAAALPRMMPMLMTAAGTLAPAHVLVIGVGVAGLSAIATARRLGAVVEAFDVRPATREQVESLGARFVAMEQAVEATQDAQGYATAVGDELLELERRTLAKRLPTTDAVITTALIPGQAPPVLLTADMVRSMRRGSVIVDLAAPFGGNCELTEAGRMVEHDGVAIIGYTDLESRAAFHASQMFSRNLTSFLLHLLPKGELRLDLDDELIRFPLVAHGGQVAAGGGA